MQINFLKEWMMYIVSIVFQNNQTFGIVEEEEYNIKKNIGYYVSKKWRTYGEWFVLARTMHKLMIFLLINKK